MSIKYNAVPTDAGMDLTITSIGDVKRSGVIFAHEDKTGKPSQLILGDQTKAKYHKLYIGGPKSTVIQMDNLRWKWVKRLLDAYNDQFTPEGALRLMDSKLDSDVDSFNAQLEADLKVRDDEYKKNATRNKILKAEMNAIKERLPQG